MSMTLPLTSELMTDPLIEGAVLGWSPASGPRPEVALESRPEGLRVKLTYLGVESGWLFPWGVPVSPAAVRGALDRVYDVLSWRVTRPPV